MALLMQWQGALSTADEEPADKSDPSTLNINEFVRFVFVIVVCCFFFNNCYNNTGKLLHQN